MRLANVCKMFVDSNLAMIITRSLRGVTVVPLFQGVSFDIPVPDARTLGSPPGLIVQVPLHGILPKTAW